MNLNHFQGRSLKTRVTVFTLVIFLLSVWSLVFFASRMLRSDMQQLLGEQQFSTASIAAADIQRELTLRLTALEEIAKKTGPAIHGSPDVLQTLLAEQTVVGQLFNGGIIAYGADGTAIADTLPAAGRVGANYIDIATVALALKSHTANIGEPLQGKKLHSPLFGMTVPIHDANGQVAGALSGVTLLGQPNFLDSITSDPYGKTGGYLLVAPQYRRVVTATDKSRVMESLPDAGLNPAMDRFLGGAEGSEVIVNPLGVEVLTSVKYIPAAGWYIATVLPSQEAFAPVHNMERRILLAALVLTLLAAALTRWVLARELSPLFSAMETLAKMAQSEDSARLLPVSREDEIGRLIGGFNRLIQTLAQRKALLRQVLNTSSVAIFVVDRQGRISLANQRMAEMFGHPLEALIGKEYVELVHASEQNLGRERMLALLASEIPAVDLERRYLRADGSEFWGHLTGRRLKDEDGQERGLVGVIADIDDKHWAAKTLRASEERFRTLMENIPSVAVQGYAPDGTVTFWNQASERLYGYSARQALGQKIFDLIIPAPMRASVSASIQQMFATGVPIPSGELQLQARDGSPVPVLSSHALVNHRGQQPELFCLDVDLSDHKRMEAALHESERRYRTMIEWTPEAIGVHRNGKVVYVNPAATHLLGAGSAQDLVGKPITDLIHPSSRAAALERAQQVATSGVPAPMMAEKYIRLDGTVIDVEVQATRIVFDGEAANLIAMRDITAQRQAQEKLQLAAKVFSHAREAIMITAANGNIIDVNDAFTRITGYTRDEVLGKNPRLLSSGQQGKDYYAALWRDLAQQGHWYGEVWNRRKNGEVYAEMQTISAVRSPQGELQQYVALFSDITAAKQHEQQLERIAHFDALTGLPNRVLLADRLHQAMAQAQRRGQQTAVAFLDLDGFKAVNDTHGHEAGDQLLVALADRMKKSLREGDTLARLGGDEFVAVLVDLADVASCVPMLTRLLAAAAQKVHVDAVDLKVSASLGVTFYPQPDNVDADQLLRQADQAMYQAKIAGKNRYHFFDAEQDRSVRGHHESLDHIRQALQSSQFVLHYQPKVNMRSGAVVGVEALIRWQHPEQGLLAPALFLPVVEDHPMAIDIGEWVMRTALTQMETWQAGGLELCVSVNVGARQLQHAAFVPRLRALLASHPEVKAQHLELEILETSALEDVAHVSRVIEACRDLGVSFALDDFGTGYSSLTYLKRLPATCIKIDQSFVRNMRDDPNDLAILDGVIGLATAFRRDVIAEGVETVEHGELLLQLGCVLAQGYGIARPMPATAVPDWVRQWRPVASWQSTAVLPREHLPLMVAAVEHRAWIKALECYFAGECAMPPALDSHHGHVGQWIDQLGRARYGAHAAFAEVEQLHQQAHALALELLNRYLDGQSEVAQTRMGELHHIKKQMLAALKSLAPGPVDGSASEP